MNNEPRNISVKDCRENSFGMFTANGNALVQNLFDRIIGMPMSTPKRMVEDEIAKGFGRIESLDNGEVWDTEVKQIFRAELYDATGKYFEIMYRTSDGNSQLAPMPNEVE